MLRAATAIYMRSGYRYRERAVQAYGELREMYRVLGNAARMRSVDRSLDRLANKLF